MGLQVNNDLSDEEEEKSNSFENNSEQDNDLLEYFYVDMYSEEQVKEIISIFKSESNVPKNLWLEKGVENQE